MKVNYKPVNDILLGQSKSSKGVRFANQPGAKLLRKYLRETYRRMARFQILAEFKKMPDCFIGHRIDNSFKK